MNRELAEKVANAVLYEGYMLYPYRPSAIKNRQRWSFGILYPPAFEEVVRGSERSAMHTECLLVAGGNPTLHLQLRFLHLMARQVRTAAGPVPSITIDGRLVESWDEGVARSVEFDLPLTGGAPQRLPFEFARSHAVETLRQSDGTHILRTQHELRGSISCSVGQLSDGMLKLAMDVRNELDLRGDASERNEALLRALLSAHMILSVEGAEFVSLLDPPDDLRDEVQRCSNVGNFPVLVGEAGERSMMLCSPIVLYDYPQIAPESAGDFFDATEIDEMLTLRVMTLSEEEKQEMSSADEHARELLERTESGAREQLIKIHGALRGLRRMSG